MILFFSHLSIDVDAELSQIRLGHVDLAHEFLVRLGDIVEGQDAPAEPEQEKGAEGDESPEGELGGGGPSRPHQSPAGVGLRGGGDGASGWTYNRHNLLLDNVRQGYQAEEEGEIELRRGTDERGVSAKQQPKRRPRGVRGREGRAGGRTEETRRPREMVC